ncbi:MAG: hypothetical protein ACYTG0_10925 [Planctomycetota bacterium]|jgi:hypothetical protein
MSVVSQRLDVGVNPVVQKRHKGDTHTAIAVALKWPDGTAVDLTDQVVSFYMVSPQGTTKVAVTTDNVVVSDDEAGEVEYSPQASDVDAEGVFYVYFRVTRGTFFTIPADTGYLKIDIVDDS